MYRIFLENSILNQLIKKLYFVVGPGFHHCDKKRPPLDSNLSQLNTEDILCCHAPHKFIPVITKTRRCIIILS
jgi:hypothetical protein